MISEKQRKILAFKYTNYDALICDGAIRSGKTSIMMWAFVNWAMSNFNNQKFAICGKTVGSAIQNVIIPFLNMSLAKKTYKMKFSRSDNLLQIKTENVTNVFELFGGKDERSQDLIQGRTLAGILLDEVALMPQSFVNQAVARCSVQGSKFWFNCNPSNPQHWFHTEWIEKKATKNALYLHFTMYDNPSLSETMLRRYESLYSGVFYERYIRGKWVSAEGLVYDNFSKDIHVIDGYEFNPHAEYYVSSDYGIQNATVFLLWQKNADGKWVCFREWYYSGRDNRKQKTVTELVDGLENVLPRTQDGEIIKPKRVIVDPSASALIVELRKNKYAVKKAINDVLEGIADVSTLLGQEKIAFTNSCENTIKEFGLYAWDEKATNRGEDAPLKQDDHAMDATRYFVKTMKLVIKKEKQAMPVMNYL